METSSPHPTGIVKRRRIIAFAAASLAVCSGALIQAKAAEPTWTPSGPVRLIVPYAPGGGTDVLARIIATQLGSSLGQPVIVENRPGVNGILGANLVYAAPANGTVLLFAAADFISVAPHIYRKVVKYDANGFTPIALAAKMGFVLASKTGASARQISEVVGQARSHELTYGHWGPGSMSQMGMELLRSKVPGTRMLAVPYAGAAPMAAAVMAGDVDYGFVPTPIAMGSRSRFTLYAIGSPQRFPALSDVPTLKEAGMDVDADTWFGVLAPPKLPQAALQVLQAQIGKVVRDPAVRAKMAENGYTPTDLSPQEFASFIRTENERWGAVVKAANIQVEEQ